MSDSASGALVLFSGGQDSTVCLAWALTRYERVETVGFDYGQRHSVELKARNDVRGAIVERFPEWAARLGEDRVVDIRAFGTIGETALTGERAIEISERGLPTTYVPGRNLVFLTYAAAIADRRGLHTLDRRHVRDRLSPAIPIAAAPPSTRWRARSTSAWSARFRSRRR